MSGEAITAFLATAAACGASDSSSDGESVQTTLAHNWPWSPWLSLLILLLAAAVVIALYMRERSDVRNAPRLTLAALRIGCLAILLFMMYGWMLNRHRTDLPDLVVVLDDSQSMSLADEYESAGEQALAQQLVRQMGWEEATRFNLAKSLLVGTSHAWLTRLSERYRVKLFLIGADARQQTAESPEQLAADLVDRTPKQDGSRLGDSLQQILQTQRGRPTAAVVLLTDGATTAGLTLPAFAEQARLRDVPLLVVGLGDANPPRDVLVRDLVTDDIVFVDDLVRFDFKIEARGFARREARVQLRRRNDENVVDERSIRLPADDVSIEVQLADRPSAEGDIEYVVEVLPLNGETNVENNRLTRRIDVRDAAIRVLLVQAYPNYEFRALKKLLQRAVKPGGVGTEKAIKLTTVLQQGDLEYARQDSSARVGFPVSRDELAEYDVLIFGDVDPVYLGAAELENIAHFVRDQGGGVIFIAGPQFTPHAYRDSPLAELFPFPASRVERPPAGEPLIEAATLHLTPLGLDAPHMQLGDTPAETAEIWSNLHGVYWLLKLLEVKPGARVLAEHPTLRQPDGHRSPAILLQFVGAGKVIFHATDETYLWSRYEGSERAFSRYWLQAIRYLSRTRLLSDRRPAEVVTDRSEYQSDDEIQISVYFRDERLAPQEDDGVTVVLEDEAGRRRLVALHRNALRHGNFAVSLNDVEPGAYRVSLATPRVDPPVEAARFRVAPPTAEFARLRMQTDDLRRTASISDGHFYTLETANRLLDDLPPGRQVRVEPLPAEPIWNSSLLAGAFVLLITAEWLLRKRAGML